ncbi:MAG: 50S ribosomal protein L25/general stress protein Ctc [Burkholderiaceae bacterium]
MKFNATERSVQGTSASRRLRHAGRVPAIVYGAKAPAVSIELDHNEIYHALRKEEFHASILTMELGQKSEQVLLRAVQWHPYKQQVLHVDFLRVDATQAINTKVPLRFVNGDASPAVKLSGAIISHVMTELDITCLPANLPQYIDADLSQLLAGVSFHLSDITLPKGVAYVSRGGDTDPVLAVGLVKSGADAEEADAPATPAAGDAAASAPEKPAE